MPCNGPDNTAWDGTTCTSTPQQTSCDSVGQTTCYYGIFDPPPQGGGQGLVAAQEYFGGQFVDKDSDCGDFRIDTPGRLAEIGVLAGDVIREINGRKPRAKVILSFTPKHPAVAGMCTRSSYDTRLILALFR